MIKVSFKSKIKQPGIDKAVPIETILEYIRTGYSQETIKSCRRIGKYLPDGARNSEYDKLKLTLPVFFPSGEFSSSTKEKDLVRFSSLIYLDFDDLSIEQELKLKDQLINKPYVYAVWKSTSNKGYSVLAYVKNYDLSIHTPDRWKSAIQQIESDLTLEGINSDNHAKKITQPVFISYDPNIYINLSPVSFQLNLDRKGKQVKKVSIAPTTKKEKSCTPSDTFLLESNPNKRIRNEVELPISEFKGEKYMIIEEGKAYAKIYRKKLKEGYRNNGISKKLIVFLALNTHLSKEGFTTCANKLNVQVCNPPLEDNELSRIINWCWRKKENNELSIKMEKRKIWFNPQHQLSPTEKQQIGGQYAGKKRKEAKEANHLKIQESILSILRNGEKLTQEKVQEETKLSLPTIKRFWKEHKYDIEELKKEYSQENKQVNMEEEGDLSTQEYLSLLLKLNSQMFAATFDFVHDNPITKEAFKIILGNRFDKVLEMDERQAKEFLIRWKDSKNKTTWNPTAPKVNPTRKGFFTFKMAA